MEVEEFVKNQFSLESLNFELCLWMVYRSDIVSDKNKIEIRNYLFERYFRIAVNIANIFYKKKGFISKREMLSNAYMGLMKAIDNYDYNKHNSFKIFAQIRIKGEVLDGMRSADTCPRRLRTKIKKIHRVEEELYTRLGEKPSQQEIMSKLQISEKVYKNTIKTYNKIVSTVSTNEEDKDMPNRHLIELSTSEKYNPENMFLDKELKLTIVQTINELPERERFIINLYFYGNATTKEIAEEMSISPQRIRQILNKAKERLRYRLSHLKDYRTIEC